jgi:hypothetical protein
MKSREEKIFLLKAIVRGETPLTELTERTIQTFYQKDVGVDLYSCAPDSMKKDENDYVTRDQITEYQKQHPKTKVLVFVHQPGNEPLDPEQNPWLQSET